MTNAENKRRSPRIAAIACLFVWTLGCGGGASKETSPPLEDASAESSPGPTSDGGLDGTTPDGTTPDGSETVPVVAQVRPTSGGTVGGTPVIITGSGFTGASSVRFGATAASSFMVISSSMITVPSSPPGSATVDVTVTAAGHTSGTNAADKFAYSDFTQSFTAGATDPHGHVVDGTELRDLSWHRILDGDALPDGTTCSKSSGCAVLFGGTGFWEDSSCATPTSQGPQILALTSTFGSWYLDHTLTGTCSTPSGGSSNFDVVNSMYDYSVRYDGSGAPINPPVDLLVVGGTDSSVDARNDSSGTWVSFAITGGSGVARSMGDHVDSSGVKPVDYLLIGNDNAGIYDATFSTSPWGLTTNATSEPWSQDGTTAGTCRDVSTCTNRVTDWPFNLAVNTWTGGSSLTLGWSSGSALRATPSPGSQVVVSGVTGCSPSPNGIETIASATKTSITIATPTTCSGASGGVITTPVNLQLGWTGALGSAPKGQVSVSGITGYVGANPNGTFTIAYSTTTSLVISTATDCSSCSGGTITTLGKSIQWPSKCDGVVGCSIPNARIVGITDCPVSNGGNTAGKASFLAVQMEIWRRVDDGGASYWKLHGAVPYPSSGYPTGQAQLRGLSCIPDPTKASGYALLTHIEGDGGMWSVDTDTGLFNEEANLVTVLGSRWGGSSGGYGIDAYNSQGIVPIAAGGKTYYVFGEGTSFGTPTTRPYETQAGGGGRMEAVSGFWVRSITSPASPASPSYTVFPADDPAKQAILNVIHPTTSAPPAGAPSPTGGFTCTSPGPCPLMISTRAGPLVSQFDEDVEDGAGQVVFFGGFDANETPVHSTAWVGRAPLSMFSFP